ncbi:hypothetical protein D9M73_253940 [compost metagenome]
MCALVCASGVTACSILYGRSQTPVMSASVCGDRFSGLSSAGQSPAWTLAISARMLSMASMKRSSSCLDSLSVGSTISVPGTGKLMVGAWKP